MQSPAESGSIQEMNSMKPALPLLITALLSYTTIAKADVRLPAVISDHMVIQQDVSAPIWGWAEPAEEVTVKLGDFSKSVKADAAGKWSVRLGTMKSGGPHTLTIQGRNTITINDVLIGEVWLGSGQSNMAMQVSRCRDFAKEQAAADLPKIRMFTEGSPASTTPQTVGKGKWVVCQPSTVGTFSGTLYFFGRELHTQLKVPVGLINSSVGGTPIESWISPEAQKASPPLKSFFSELEKELAAFDPVAAKAKYEASLAAWKAASAKARAEGKEVPRAPQDPVALQQRKSNVGGLYNGKIVPLVPYAIRGVVWYQGEANTAAGKAQYYEHQLELLVNQWRKAWGQEHLPFAWVQLPNFNGPGRDFPLVREAMLKTLKLPETGMAITIDIGEANDIHPKNKQDVGLRLAAWALGPVYLVKGVVPSGPIPDKIETAGNGFRVKFRYGEGLNAAGGEIKGLEVSDAEGKWHPAKGTMDGSALLVSAENVKAPKGIRYAWTNNPVCNLYNGAKLPASPFRWPLNESR
jgi:sialate O-acetylesterase